MITVFGLGNVGLVYSLYLADNGEKVNGIEINQEKIKTLEKQDLYFYEPGLKNLLENNLNISFFPSSSVKDFHLNKIIVVTVGTPPNQDGSVHLEQIIKTTDTIINNINDPSAKITIIYRSTVPPGTMENIIIPKFPKKIFSGVTITFMPEFLREGSALKDLEKEVTILASEHPLTKNELKALRIKKVKYVDFKTAEMIKYFNNSFHALKIAYANEIGNIATQLEVNKEELLDLFLSDTTLNISKAYLSPAFGFGGTCLNKDTKAIQKIGHQLGLKIPLLDNILTSNDEHISKLTRVLENDQYQKVLFCGISFKPDTDDCRFAPILQSLDFFKDGPSYLQKKIFNYYDPLCYYKGQNIAKVESLTSHLKKNDLIVFGPLKLSDKEYRDIHLADKKCLDLHYHPVPKYMKTQNYFSIFD